jgi:hypothetical protein
MIKPKEPLMFWRAIPRSQSSSQIDYRLRKRVRLPAWGFCILSAIELRTGEWKGDRVVLLWSYHAEYQAAVARVDAYPLNWLLPWIAIRIAKSIETLA